jgi:phage gp46-like protein
MTDIKIRWDSGLVEGDFIFEDNDLSMDEGLATAVLISWFTDARAGDDDPIPNANNDQEFIDKRGWWGDKVDEIVQDDKIGSLLWLGARDKATIENQNRQVQRATDALEWMKEDGVAKEITVTGERIELNNITVLALAAQIVKADGNEVNITFDPLWFATLLED